MNNIAVIIPINEFNKDTDAKYLERAVDSVKENIKTFDGDIKLYIIGPEKVRKDIMDSLHDINYSFIINNDKTDYCSQINVAVDNIGCEYFSILEYDDYYTSKWFKSAKEYFYTNEDASVFLPINVVTEVNVGSQFCNETVWASGFSEETGYIDFNCLQDFSGFNLTGGIFNTVDFKEIGGLKPSIKVAFNYEYLLRLTHRNLKAYVVPKEGYCHIINRKNSLTETYNKEMTVEEVSSWFELAKLEYPYKEDRQTQPSDVKKDEEALK